MVVARWQIEAQFGHKQIVIDLLKKWHEEIGSQIGWTPDKVRILSGSVGALESSVVTEVLINDLAELSESWQQLGGIEAHQQWSKDLEPSIVSGTPHWQVFHVV